jgi:PAS domain S-box-containing protein
MDPASITSPSASTWPAGGGEMARRIGRHDWASTPLGPIHTWPGHLKTAVALMLDLPLPASIYYGQEAILLYNDAWAPLLGLQHPAALGRSAFDAFADRITQFRPQFDRVWRGEAISLVQPVHALSAEASHEGRWFSTSSTPLHDEAGNVAGIWVIGTETAAAPRSREQHDGDMPHPGSAGANRNAAPNHPFLLKLSNALRPAGDPAQAQAAACRLLGQALGADRVFYGDIDENGQTARVWLDYFRPGLSSLQGTYCIGDILAVGTALRRGRPLVVNDLQRSELLPRGLRQVLSQAGIGAFVSVPRVKHGNLDWTLSVAAAAPRHWKEQEVRLVQTVGERTWELVERAAVDAALQSAAARDAFRIALYDALRRLSSPIEIQTEAASAVGKHLQADRVLYAEVTETGAAVIGTEYCAKGMRSMVGRHRLKDMGAAGAALQSGGTVVEPDVAAADNLTIEEKSANGRYGTAARIAVPLVKDGRLAAMLAVHQAAPRRWTADEVALIEETAERTWAAVERARAEASLRQSEARLAADLAGMTRLYRLNERLSNASSLAEVLDEVLIAAMEMAGATRGNIQLLAADGKSLTMVAHKGHGSAFVEYFSGTSTASPCRSALEARQRVMIPDVTFEPSLRGTPELEVILSDGVRSLQCTPLLSDEGRVVGILATYFAYPYRPSENELRLLDLLAWTAAGFIERARAASLLRASEERHRLIVGNVTEYAIFMTDPQGNILTWNPGAQRIFGYLDHEIVGRNGAELFVPEDQAAGAPAKELETALTRGQASDDRWQMRKGGERFFASGVTAPLRDGEGALRGFVKVCRDLTERRQIDEQRERLFEQEKMARLAAERATLIKDEFLAVVSHELRTPLSSILLWAKLLRSGGARDMPQAIESIIVSAEAQQQLVDDLLDISRMITGKLRLNVRDTEVLPVVRAAIHAVRPMATAKQVHIVESLDKSPGVARIDAHRIEQVLWNLLNNAVKFTESGGQLHVQLRRLEHVIQIQVRDTGRGITPDFLPHVFERFSQADGSNTRVHGGLGIGLAISRQLVELHGGSIRAESSGEGRGATFTVELPISAPPARRRTPPKPAASAAAKDDAEALRGLRVLLVEDDLPSRQAIQTFLKRYKAKVTAVDSAADALVQIRKSLKRRRFDVLVTDIGMPIMDGYQLLSELRALEAQHGKAPLPAIAVTAYAADQDRLRAISGGFAFHVSKPIEPATLLHTLKSAVESR